MITIRRVLHHGGWFALLGPCVGLAVAIISIFIIAWQYHESAGVFLKHILTLLPALIIVTWLIGAFPALLTGIAVACLPAGIYRSRCWRTLASAAIGLIVSVVLAVVNLLIFSDKNLMRFILGEDAFQLVAGAGLLAGIVMGWLIPYLPGLRVEESTSE